MACPELFLFGLSVHFVTEGTTSIIIAVHPPKSVKGTIHVFSPTEKYPCPTARTAHAV
ncbi:hypothetical protein PF005_g26661 [Phytophthora fragariae]|uniref:Uncharacterized protein n=1 Tax=Phytophthora fragariae TaxID=53985 RepID=A0A6A3Q930_9STRA|nr:hypothetical protein PF003_g5949 [Phytophthora fragariae]KAE8920874.1 hypothetical protein PF009_g28836 [Phytophthora fragariae]KAE9071206.1 hypothetical protein PF007_g26647 [Phytophthora fragariae]KAE9086021.1 hypothetical protein PF006_g26113 [Phytophthora fragariae]KAE9172550.1 hypothetical protein PF005_g26661 [Phytophthora fragariae]